MTSQESEHDTRLEFRSPPRARERQPKHPPSRDGAEDLDLGLSASNRAVGITLAIGVGLMLLVLMLPYLSGY
ncbi:hypothetical protein [Nesterenkonia alba]|uniref:hypothetical protein n=1 Tax=Nesterenkonia alba TaxID=515814 RepID=UPI0003B71C3D|nr:hypothetical protein [Nesterenkonia alba]